jgi:ubiquinone/menaquinone biosynthesis C-methylase UbiE
MSVRSKEITRLNEKKWDAIAETYETKYFASYLSSGQKKVISLLDLNENKRLLDLSCGTGRALNYAPSFARGVGTYYGIDISSKMIEKAKEKFPGHKNIVFRRASAEDLPFKKGFFDLIICTNAFHHYYNPSKVLKEVHRVLKSKGKLFLLDMTTDVPIMRIIDSIVKVLDESHIKLYSTKEYRMFFRNAGLKYLKTVPVGPISKIHIGENE